MGRSILLRLFVLSVLVSPTAPLVTRRLRFGIIPVRSLTLSTRNHEESLVAAQTRLLNQHGSQAFTALSFFKFVSISGDIEAIANAARNVLQIIPSCFGTLYIAQEGVNSALHLPTCALIQTKAALEATIPNLGELRFNLGETRSNWDVAPFKKLLVKPRQFVLTDGLPERLNWSDSGHDLSAR